MEFYYFSAFAEDTSRIGRLASQKAPARVCACLTAAYRPTSCAQDEKAVEVMDQIFMLLGTETRMPVICVLAVDSEVISRAIAHKYEGEDARLRAMEYLGKILQLSIGGPPSSFVALWAHTSFVAHRGTAHTLHPQ